MLREFHFLPSLHLSWLPFSAPNPVWFNLSKWMLQPQGLEEWHVDKQELSSWGSLSTPHLHHTHHPPYLTLGLEAPQRKHSRRILCGDSLGKDDLDLASPGSGECDLNIHRSGDLGAWALGAVSLTLVLPVICYVTLDKSLVAIALGLGDKDLQRLSQGDSVQNQAETGSKASRDCRAPLTTGNSLELHLLNSKKRGRINNHCVN